MKSPIDSKQMATIDALSHDGRGIACIGNKKLFLRNALPGEQVYFNLLKKHRQYDEGEATQIITPSPDRQNPSCMHFGICGGCAVQHISNSLQLSYKQQFVLEQLKHFGNVIPEIILPPTQTDFLGYRRKARLGVRFVHKKNKLLIGFREHQGRYLADIEACPVLHPKLGLHLNDLRETLTQLSCYESIPQIEFAMGDEEAALVFRHLKPLSDVDQQILIEFGKQFHFDIYLQPNSPLPIQKIYKENSIHRLIYSLPQYHLQFLFHPCDFTQVNLTLNRALIDLTMQALSLNKDDVVLDLFCGIGNFTLPASQQVKKIVGIEGSQIMVDRATENAKLNQCHTAEFFCADLQNIKQPHFENLSPSKIILDPPRSGAKEILPLIAKLKPQRIAYISCHPASLARDAGELVHTHGFTLEKLGILNMFPHTAHVETLAIFDKKS